MSGFWADWFKDEAQLESADKGLAEQLEQNYGILVEKIDKKEFDKTGFLEISEDKFAQFTSVLQQVPGLFANKSVADTFEGAYRLVLPENLPLYAELTPISTLGTGVTNTTFRDVTKKGKPFVAQAGIEKIEKAAVAAPQIAYAAFSVASIATGQYFMQRIDKKLKGIDRCSKEILQFLELEKASTLQAQQAYLEEIQQNLSAILSCQAQRQATIVSVQTIRQNALSSILFYCRQIAASLAGIGSKKDNKEKTWERIDKVVSNFPFYWLSLHLYGMSSLSELMLTRNTDSTYLNYIQSDIKKYCDDYEQCYRNCEEKVNAQIDSMEEGKKLLFAAKAASFALPAAVCVLTQKMADDLYNKRQEKIRGDARDAYTEGVKSYAEPQQLKAMEESVGLLNQMYHSPVELALEGERLYIKLPERE